MKIQLQEYEQLLEDERQAYEDNRKSVSLMRMIDVCVGSMPG